jgi:hypothetical protein
MYVVAGLLLVVVCHVIAWYLFPWQIPSKLERGDKWSIDTD